MTRQRMKINKFSQISLSEIKAALRIRSEQYRASAFWKRFEGERKGPSDEEEMVNEIDEDEIECLLAALISKKLLKGYVAHETACVLSSDPNKAFPPIKACRQWWINDF